MTNETYPRETWPRELRAIADKLTELIAPSYPGEAYPIDFLRSIADELAQCKVPECGVAAIDGKEKCQEHQYYQFPVSIELTRSEAHTVGALITEIRCGVLPPLPYETACELDRANVKIERALNPELSAVQARKSVMLATSEVAPGRTRRPINAPELTIEVPLVDLTDLANTLPYPLTAIEGAQDYLKKSIEVAADMAMAEGIALGYAVDMLAGVIKTMLVENVLTRAQQQDKRPRVDDVGFGLRSDRMQMQYHLPHFVGTPVEFQNAKGEVTGTARVASVEVHEISGDGDVLTAKVIKAHESAVKLVRDCAKKAGIPFVVGAIGRHIVEMGEEAERRFFELQRLQIDHDYTKSCKAKVAELEGSNVVVCDNPDCGWQRVLTT